MDATIVIPSYKSEKTIKRCLESLLKQNTKFTYEIILVDSSPDNKVDGIVHKFPKIKFIKLGNRTYPGIARNVGANEALGDLLLFVDGDIIAPHDLLENSVEYYKKGHNVFGGSLDMWKGKGVGILEKIDWFFESSDYRPSMKEGVRWCLPAVALAIKKELFQNEKFPDIETSEDVELTVRLRNKGNILYFNPSLTVSHIFYDTFEELLKKAFNFGRDNMRIRKLYNMPGSYFVHMPLLSFFVVPCFAFVKILKISWRNIIYNSSWDKMLYILTLPLMAVVVLFWMLGFYNGLTIERHLLC